MRLDARMLAIGGVLLLSACEQTGSPGSGAADVPVFSATQTSQDIGDYVVHFNAVPADEISAQVASQYGIARSASQALLTVSVRRKLDGMADTGARAALSVSATNLTGQLKSMTMREITEEDAVYYIGQVAVTNAETLIFTINLTPENEPESHTIRYMKQFYLD